MLPLAMNTREQEMIRLGVSPRGALAVTRLARQELMYREEIMLPRKMCRKSFLDVCAHRIILNPKAKIAALSASDVLIEVFKTDKNHRITVDRRDYGKIKDSMGI